MLNLITSLHVVLGRFIGDWDAGSGPGVCGTGTQFKFNIFILRQQNAKIIVKKNIT